VFFYWEKIIAYVIIKKRSEGMLYMLEVSVPCETPTILRLFMILGKIINIVKLIVPIILVVIATIEVAKMVLDSEEKISKSIKLVVINL